MNTNLKIIEEITVNNTTMSTVYNYKEVGFDIRDVIPYNIFTKNYRFAYLFIQLTKEKAEEILLESKMKNIDIVDAYYSDDLFTYQITTYDSQFDLESYVMKLIDFIKMKL